MVRHLFAMLSIVSLLLCVAIVVLWARSYTRIDVVRNVAASQQAAWDVESNAGWLAAAEAREWADWTTYRTQVRFLQVRARRYKAAIEALRPVYEASQWNFVSPSLDNGYACLDHPILLFKRQARRSFSRERLQYAQAVEHLSALRPTTRVYAPYRVRHGWLAAAAGLLPGSWLLRARLTARGRRRAADRTLCHSCGYDLRASPGRCPECGALPAAKGVA